MHVSGGGVQVKQMFGRAKRGQKKEIYYFPSFLFIKYFSVLSKGLLVKARVLECICHARLHNVGIFGCTLVSI